MQQDREEKASVTAEVWDLVVEEQEKVAAGDKAGLVARGKAKVKVVAGGKPKAENKMSKLPLEKGV